MTPARAALYGAGWAFIISEAVSGLIVHSWVFLVFMGLAVICFLLGDYLAPHLKFDVGVRNHK